MASTIAAVFDSYSVWWFACAGCGHAGVTQVPVGDYLDDMPPTMRAKFIAGRHAETLAVLARQTPCPTCGGRVFAFTGEAVHESVAAPVHG